VPDEDDDVDDCEPAAEPAWDVAEAALNEDNAAVPVERPERETDI
jgi:hypothetical protein